MITIALVPTKEQTDHDFIHKNLGSFPKEQWKLIKLARRYYLDSNIDVIFAEFLSGSRPFFTANNAKFVKSRKININVVGLSLAHSWVSGRNLCPFSTLNCTKSCISTTGAQNNMKRIPMLAGEELSTDWKCKLDRTKLYFEDYKKFKMLVKIEVEKQYQVSKARQIVDGVKSKTGIRFQTTSDLDFGKLILEMQKEILDLKEYVSFYDYTKGIVRIDNHHKDYDLSYSYNDNTTISDCFHVLESNHNVVIVLEFMKKSDFPFSKISFSENGKTLIADLVSGDDHDLRAIDPKSNHKRKSYKVIYLKQKVSGLTKKQFNKDNSFFLSAENPPQGIQFIK